MAQETGAEVIGGPVRNTHNPVAHPADASRKDAKRVIQDRLRGGREDKDRLTRHLEEWLRNREQ